MILFLEDWAKHPYAIIDDTTKNESFKRIVGVYKKMGIRNHAFPLALHNQSLRGVDPYSENLTLEQMEAIAIEAKENPWYFFREILKAPTGGSFTNPPIRANRANIAMWWLFNNHITQMVIQPRQTGKSLCADGNTVWLLGLAAEETKILLLTRSDALRTANVNRIKNLLESLPSYLQFKNRSDAYNTEKITVNELGNSFLTEVGQSSIKAAQSVGRGFTVPIFQIDEMPFVNNVRISLPVLLAAGGAAVDNARANGGHYGNIFTTTAGYLSTDSGEFAHQFYMDCLRWSEHLLDCYNQEDLYNTIRKNSPSKKVQVLCEFNHRQLGFTDEWLREKISSSMAQGENAEADFLNKWAEGGESCPIQKDILESIVASGIPEPNVRVSHYGYMIRWYVSEYEIDSHCANRTLVMGLDTSDAVGNDFIAMVIRDAESGETIATGIYNETNLITFSEWIVEMLVQYPNITLIIERRSSGVAIIDNLLRLLPEKGVDPFRRIFNWVTNDCDGNEEYKKIVTGGVYGRDHLSYIKYKKEFGYATSAVGRASRDKLYGAAFTAATRYTCRTVRDLTLISQLTSLVIINGRIDHREGEHDDMVIAWLLTYWFLVYAKNLSLYNISSRTVLLTVNNEIIQERGGVEAIREKTRQDNLVRQIEALLEELKKETNPAKAELLSNRIKLLYKGVKSDVVGEKFNLETLLNEIKSNSKRKLINSNMRYVW